MLIPMAILMLVLAAKALVAGQIVSGVILAVGFLASLPVIGSVTKRHVPIRSAWPTATRREEP